MLNLAQIRLMEASKAGYVCCKEGFVVSPKGRELILRPNDQGYLVFRCPLTITPVGYIKVHRLQALQKYGLALFEPGIVVRHLDGQKCNNSWENIAIGTNSDNQLDISEEVRISRASKVGKISASKTKKIPESSYKEIWDMYQNTGSKKATCFHFAEIFDCHPSAIHKFLSGKTYKLENSTIGGDQSEV